MSRVNVYTHCAACDTALNDTQPTDPNTGEASDLCGICRKIVRKAMIFHKEDIIELETTVWRAKLGGDDLLSNASEDFSPRGVDKLYHGADLD